MVSTFVQAESVDAVCAALAEDPDETKVIAGGTALVLMMRQGLVDPARLVSLERLDALRGVSLDDNTLVLGACTSLTDVAADDQVLQRAPSLAYACQRVGNVRVRNRATIAGNVAEADYASDPPAVLITLDAECVIQGPGGERRAPVREVITGFYETSLAEGEVITAVRVPTWPSASTYHKYISRSSEDRPCVGVAAAARFAGDEIARLTVTVGATAELPQRFDDVTDAVHGGVLDADTRAQVAAAYAERIEPISDARGSAWYRTRMVEVFVRRALEDLAHAHGVAGGVR